MPKKTTFRRTSFSGNKVGVAVQPDSDQNFEFIDTSFTNNEIGAIFGSVRIEIPEKLRIDMVESYSDAISRGLSEKQAVDEVLGKEKVKKFLFSNGIALTDLSINFMSLLRNLGAL